MTKILLVRPYRPLHTADYVRVFFQALVAPADLATIAALTPAGFEVHIWDEAVRGKIESAATLREPYDIIGVGGYSADYERAITLGRVLKEVPVAIVVGGVGVSSEPERYRDVFDVLFIGEAEYTWPRFLQDFRTGSYQKEYRQVSRVDMRDSPPPRWDIMADEIEFYGQTVVQTTRGCPFDCEFCDVVESLSRHGPRAWPP